MAQVSLGYNYLKNNMSMRFPEVRARAAAAQAEAQERQVCLSRQHIQGLLACVLLKLMCYAVTGFPVRELLNDDERDSRITDC